MLPVCMRVPNELAVSVLRGPVRNRNRHSSNRKSGVSEERVRVLETCRRSNSKDRSRWCVAGRVTRFDYYYCQKRPVPAPLFSSLSFSLSSPPLFPGRAKEDLFSLARIHARTSPVHAARATLVCGMHMYAAFYEFKCEQRGPGGRASAISLVAPPSFLVDPRWIFSRKRRFLLEQKFSFITVGLILLLSFFCNWNCSY